MEIEYEATFININKDEYREKLGKIGAKLLRPEFLQKRFCFDLPNITTEQKFIRVRDEGDKVTMTYKEFNGNKINDQKEINLVIDSFESGEDFLKTIGCNKKSYQETKREIWNLDEVDICIDEWPFLEPFIEIEGKSEDSVKAIAAKLGFDYSKALFCSAGAIYSEKYNLPENIINRAVPKIVFDMENPFINYKKEN